VSTPYRLGTIQYSQVKKGDEMSLLEALNKGPIYVGINAKTSVFMSYKAGVINLNSVNCSPTTITHAVLLVGYGRDSRTGLDFWKIKNSWSTTWGETGYVRIARGKNVCGIGNSAYQATIT
jgi:C1A family cysteine protease